MGLLGALNTSISGMAAQSSYLSAIGDNIANSGTTGYKDAVTQFETLLGTQASSTYQSGGVLSRTSYNLGQQGTLETTTSSTDLAVDGTGFFVVQNGSGAVGMTRAGSFKQNVDGNLVNAAGYELMGYDLTNGASASGSSQLQLVSISTTGLPASASSSGTLTVNLPASATAMAPDKLPSANTDTSAYTEKTTMTAYDNLGNAVTLDVYLTKTGDDTWEASAFNHANAAAGGSFPYSSGALDTETLTFDPTTGSLSGSSATSLSVTIPNGKTVSIDLSNSTSMAGDFSTSVSTLNGNTPSAFSNISIKDGVISAVYANGTAVPKYQIALATVASTDNLTVANGNFYTANAESGPMTVGTAGQGMFGSIESGALEASTVDLATQLSDMISAQRGYEANTKVMQAASDLLKLLNNIQT